MVSFAQGTKREVFLVVSRPQFQEGLQEFVQWKRQEGFDVVELYVETGQRMLVQEAIVNQLPADSSLWPAYLLLVGDHEQLEAFPGNTALDGEAHFTDLPYADFAGDYQPEALLGRWPVNDTVELRTVVEKTLRYEQFSSMDTAQLRRVLLVAGREYGNPAPTTTNGQVNYLKREVKLSHPELDTLCWYNPDSDGQGEAITDAIGQGACLMNFTGHCTFSGWNHPTLTAEMVEAAGMTQPSVWVNNGCQSNGFAGTGFGERLLRMPVGGAVGVVGATNSTLWAEDYYWALGAKDTLSLDPPYDSTSPGAFDGLVRRQRTTATLGELLRDGNRAVEASGSAYTRFYWEIYCLLGDPSLKPWLGIPQPMTLTVDSVQVGQSEVSVEGTPGARVTAVQGNELLGLADIDNSGHAVIVLQRVLDTLPLFITATGVDRRPLMVTFDLDTSSVGTNTPHLSPLTFHLYPNPACSDITIETSRPMVLTVFDLQGHIVISPTSVNTSFIIPHSSLRPGIYFVNAVTDKETFGRKLIIR